MSGGSHGDSQSVSAKLDGLQFGELERTFAPPRWLRDLGRTSWILVAFAALLVGEDGRSLSGGERQRLTVARALLSDAPVLLLDEPTAHLDPETARALVEDVIDTVGQRTVLLITHRPEGLDLMDEIVTLPPPP